MSMKRVSILAALLALLMLLGACAAPAAPAATPAATEAPAATQAPAETPEPTPEPVEILVSAAASLTDVLQQIAESYKTVAPNVMVTFSFGSSGTLQTQIEEGAPADAFVSAAQKQMDALAEKNLIAADTRKDLLVNKVVLILPANSMADIKSFEDVVTDKVKMVGVGESSVPVGQYAEEVFTTLGVWDQVKAKANFGTDVRQVLSWVESGDVDCGIVYATDAATTTGVKIVAEAPEGSHKPVVYPAAVLANAAQSDAAKAFLDYLSSDDAVALFEAAGFTMYQG